MVKWNAKANKEQEEVVKEVEAEVVDDPQTSELKQPEVTQEQEEEQQEEQVQMGYEDAITAISTDLIIVATRLAGPHNKKQSEVLQSVADKVTEITG